MRPALPSATYTTLPPVGPPGSLAARCSSPIRLAGERLTLNRDTGETVERFASTDAPFGVVLLACGNRRASRCQSRSDVYRHDAYALVRAGVAGDAERGVPVDVSSHPRIFATFTAPSFGAVHRRVVRAFDHVEVFDDHAEAHWRETEEPVTSSIDVSSWLRR